MGQTIYFLNPYGKRNMLLLLVAIFIQVLVLMTPVQPLTLNIWPTQQLQGRTIFPWSWWLFSHMPTRIYKKILFEFLQGYIGFMSLKPVKGLLSNWNNEFCFVYFCEKHSYCGIEMFHFYVNNESLFLCFGIRCERVCLVNFYMKDILLCQYWIFIAMQCYCFA